ncbi:MAG: FAD-dependent monooxygenase [Chitinophagales bacterium]|nr:FAD-dependent monooxygenase [Chitinophagales bacterium]
MSKLYDICIVGAGVAGASVAAHLSKYKLKIALIDSCFEERDRIVGELMQPGGVYMLEQLGISEALHQIETSEIKGYALFNKDQEVLINYPSDAANTHLSGRGLNNGKFIQALRSLSADKENVERYTAKAIDFVEFDEQIEGVIIEDNLGNKSSVLAKLTIVCDGFFSSLRAKLIPECKEVTSHFLGFVLENCTLPHEAYGHIFMGGEAPFLCYRISSEQIRILVDFPGSEAPKKGEELKQYLVQDILPQLPNSMHASFLAAIEEAKFKYMPNHYMHSSVCSKKGLAMLGDALNMRHPLTGGGMTATLTDVMLLCKAIMDEHNILKTNDLSESILKYYEDRKDWNASINILADALYKVSLNPSLKDACFQYLAQGDAYSREPIELLSGISRDNSILFKHFIQVALLGAKSNLSKDFGLKSFDCSYELLKDASKILLPLIKKEKFVFKDFINNKSLYQLAAAS